jgi:hypothetical protein
MPSWTHPEVPQTSHKPRLWDYKYVVLAIVLIVALGVVLIVHSLG